MKFHLRTILFSFFAFVSLFVPFTASANTTTDTLNKVVRFYTDSLRGATQSVEEMLYFFEPLAYDSALAAKHSIDTAYTGSNIFLKTLVSVGVQVQNGYLEGITRTGNETALALSKTKEASRTINASISEATNALGNAGYKGVANIFIGSHAIADFFLTSHVSVLQKTGESIGVVVVGTQSVAQSVLTHEQKYSTSVATVVLGAHNTFIQGLSKGIVNTIFFYKNATEGSLGYAATSATNSLASVGSAWNYFVDRLSTPLVPLFLDGVTPTYVPVVKKGGVVTSLPQKNNDTTISGSESLKNTQRTIVERIIQLPSAINYLAKIDELRKELVSLNSSTADYLRSLIRNQNDRTVTNITNNSTIVTSASSTASSGNGTFTGTFSGDVTADTLTVGGTSTSTFVGAISSDDDIYARAFYGDGSHLTGITSFSTTTTRGVFSSVAPGIIYDQSSGVFSLDAAYTLPLIASTTEWGAKVSSQWVSGLLGSLSYTGGNVGVGTSNPTALFQIQKPSDSTRAISFTMDDPKISFANGGEATGDISNTYGSFQFGRDNNAYFGISEAGVVGTIGGDTIGGGLPVYRNIIDDGSGDASFAGSLTANTFHGNGSGITNLDLSTYDLSELTNHTGFLSTNDDISNLNNNAGYIVGGANISIFNNDAGYIANGDSISGMFNDVGYITNNTASLDTSKITSGTLGVTRGGTGVGTAPSYGQILVGNALGGYTLTATSSLGIVGSRWAASGSDIYYNTGNVGIGTTTPGSKLFITNTTPTTVAATIQAASSQSADLLDFTSSSNSILAKIRSDGIIFSSGFRSIDGNMNLHSTALFLGSGGADTSISRLSAGVMQIGSGGGSNALGTLIAANIGIGTSTPMAKLAILGTAGADSFIIASSTGSTLLKVGQSGVSIGADTNTSLTEFGSRDFATRVDSSANSGYGIVLERTSTGGSNTSNFAFLTKRTSSAALINTDYNGRISSFGWDGTQGVLSSSLDFIVDNTVSAGVVPTGISFKTGTRNSDLTERLRITSGGGVGIGTTAPGGPFEVASSKEITNFTQDPFVRFKNALNTSNGHTNLVFDTTHSSASTGFGFRIAGANKWDILVNNDINFRDAQNSFASALFLKAGGKVGIGTISPTTGLEIASPYVGGKGSLFINPASGHSYASINSVAAAEAGIFFSKAGTVKWQTLVGANSNDLSFWDSTAERVTFKSGGNVGLGVTSPVQPLDIYAGGGGDGTVNEAFGLRIRGTNVTGNSSTLQLGANSTTNTYIQSAYWGSGYTAPLYINPKGATVYINATNSTTATTSIASLITGGDILIKGPVATNARMGRLGFSAAGAYGTSGAFPAFIAGYADNGVWSGGVGLTFNTISGADISGSNGSERMRITSAGNVGIGITNPTNLFSVSGNTSAALQFISQSGSGSALQANNNSSGNGVYAYSASGVGLNASGGTYGVTGAGTNFGVQGQSVAGIPTVSYLLNTSATNNIMTSVSLKHQITGAPLAGFGERILSQLSSTGSVTPVDATAINTFWTDPTHVSRTAAISFSTVNNGGSLAEVFRISGNGNLGAGTTTPWRTLSVTGTVGFDGITGASGAGSLCLSANKEVVYNSGSDSCLPSLRETKHDITDLSFSASDMIAQLKPVSFVYNTDASSTVRYGFIAEDTVLVDTHLATYDATGKISGIDDRSVLSVLVKAFKEIKTSLDSIVAWFGDGKFKVQNDICVDDVCVTKDQFKQMLLNNGGAQHTTGVPVQDTSNGSTTSTTTPDTTGGDVVPVGDETTNPPSENPPITGDAVPTPPEEPVPAL